MTQKKKEPKSSRTGSLRVNKRDVLAQLRGLRRYIVGATSGNCGEGGKADVFTGCLRASLSKCYEFNLYAWDPKNEGGAVFALPTLRGVCEELIFLNFLQRIDATQRDSLLERLLNNGGADHTFIAT